MSLREVMGAFQRAIDEKKPISLSCVGDGEMYFIAYKMLPYFSKADQVWGKTKYLKYLMDQSVRDQVLEGAIHSDIIGIQAGWPASAIFLDHYTSIPLDHICDSCIGKGLHFSGLLYELLKNKRVYLVGNYVHFLLPVLEKYQVTVAGSTTVDYFDDIPRVKDCLSKVDFDVALLSAGVPTLILAPWIARSLKRCALDFGDAINLVTNNIQYIGANRDDYTIFNPDAKMDFRFVPDEIRLAKRL